MPGLAPLTEKGASPREGGDTPGAHEQGRFRWWAGAEEGLEGPRICPRHGCLGSAPIFAICRKKGARCLHVHL